ncbi:hypothetical protein VPH35_108291 [Triticum aestivum]|uniref:Uncharacterized protein n=1 Tax=Triticum turgidum subsp. durum TaxID=4567 RepID=A0A9R1B6E7_TRITD|nr:unnamed protein product [Triticum turgidum subsp. durum]
MCDLFYKKYGKDFVAAAVDICPNVCVFHLFFCKAICCHYCMYFMVTIEINDVLLKVIEKLSVNKPCRQFKLEVLKDIAKEHQIDWDRSEAEQELLKPAEELIYVILKLQCHILLFYIVYSL